VLDDGPGFPPRLLETGVRSFAQAGGEGTGLGLAIVRRFARELGGQMTLANREPRGACVRLVLPCPAGHG
jgi:signal transduction histidine kinase